MMYGMNINYLSVCEFVYQNPELVFGNRYSIFIRGEFWRRQLYSVRPGI